MIIRHYANDLMYIFLIANFKKKISIDHNLQNNAFSELLKILKHHAYFNYCPIDVRTLYHTHSNVSYNQPAQVQTIPQHHTCMVYIIVFALVMVLKCISIKIFLDKE